MDMLAHRVVARWLITNVPWHIMNRNRTPFRLGVVRQRAVPSHTVMVADLTFLDLEWHRLYFHARGQQFRKLMLRHMVWAMEQVPLVISPCMTTRHHPHATVLNN